MAGRKSLDHSSRRVSHPTAVLALVAACLAAASAFEFHHAAAQQTPRAASDTTPDPSSLLQAATAEKGSSSVSFGEFEGSFDPSARRLKIYRQTAGHAKHQSQSSLSGQSRSEVQARSSANTPLPPGSYTIRLTDTNGPAADSVFLSSGDLAGTVSGEMEIVNNSAYTFYNTRVVFTDFRVGSSGGAGASNLPGSAGLAYYNDGQVAFNGKLNVSRNYGDIPSGGSGKAIWTFRTQASGPVFYFNFQILADLGVAVESVEPAAVQVSATVGSSIVISGRGFTATPAVSLLDGAGNLVANLQVVSLTVAQIIAVIPPGVASGSYSVSVINPGGVAGGAGSSLLSGRLTVTGPPDAAHTLSGVISAFGDTGPYLISSNVTISSDLSILPGTVIYFASGTSLQIAAGGNLTANGGIPGVPNGAGVATPKQIVFTAQRQAVLNGALPAQGAWNGIDATSTSTARMVLRNCVIEYGGNTGNAQINISGSGRTLQFTDSISRKSAGTGLAAAGVFDALTGFARSRIEGNGAAPTDPALLLSGNAALGLYDLDGTTGGTSVGDANYYYSSANVFTGNSNNVVQIGTDAQPTSNDFTKSGVLVGQGDTPLQIRGSSTNPSVVGNANAPAGAELSISPGATVQLAPGTDLEAGDFARGIFGAVAANGFAGVTQVPGAALGSSKFITFDEVPGGSNFGAIYFSRNASGSSILNYALVQNGGASALGQAAVIADGVAIKVLNSQISNTASGNLLQIHGGKIEAGNTNFNAVIDTIAGSLLGDGNPATLAQFVTPVSVARDPQGRGIYVSDVTASSTNLIRFINTGNSAVTIAGQAIAPGTVKTVAGNGIDIGENSPGLQTDVGSVTGLAVSPDGKLLHYIESLSSLVRALNVSASPTPVGSAMIDSGSIGTLAGGTPFGTTLNGLSVNPMTGDLYLADATSGVNKVFKITPGGAVTIVAGNGAATSAATPPSLPAVATSVPLLQPRAVKVDGSGNVYIADTGHGRTVVLAPGGTLSLVAEFSAGSGGAFQSGLALLNGVLYAANGNDQTVVRVSGGQTTIVAGLMRAFCDYSNSSCGDGGPGPAAGLNLLGSTASPPLAGIEADANGLYILDQGSTLKGRVRYLNLSSVPVTLAGVTVAPNTINTIAGTGLLPPYDGGLATSASLSSPVGLAADANNNLYIADTFSSRLRFVNRGTSEVTLFAGTAVAQTVPAGTIVAINKDAGLGTGDGTTANQAAFDTPQGMALTAQGIFIADSRRGPTVPSNSFNGKRTGTIRFLNTTAATITLFPAAPTPIVVPPANVVTIAGGTTNTTGNGDGSFALGNAKLLDPTDVAVSPLTGDIYIADVGNKAVRKISSGTGIITSLNLPQAQYTGLGFDQTGRLYVVNTDSSHVLYEDSPGSGTFKQMDAGAGLSKPRDVAIDAAGNAYVTNSSSHKIMKITPSGVVTTFAGSTQGYGGDQGLATSAQLNINPITLNLGSSATPFNVPQTVGITISPNGEILFTDTVNNRIRRLR